MRNGARLILGLILVAASVQGAAQATGKTVATNSTGVEKYAGILLEN